MATRVRTAASRTPSVENTLRASDPARTRRSSRSRRNTRAACSAGGKKGGVKIQRRPKRVGWRLVGDPDRDDRGLRRYEGDDGRRARHAICLMITGIGFVAVLTASAAERFMRGRRAEEERARAERQAIEQRLDQIIARLDAIERP